MVLPPSPPEEYGLDVSIDTAERVLQAQGAAITALSWCFSPGSRADGPAASFAFSLSLMRQSILRGNKIVISGMGKSHKIGSKLVATLHSFGIPAASLHPSDALHGDVGQVRSGDVVVLVSASGNSPELAALIKHLPDIQLVCLTCNDESPLAQLSDGIIYAPCPPEQREQALYGLPAPTVTTTLCLALGDAMCVALYESLERNLKLRRSNFTKWHPGGAIGLANGKLDDQGVLAWSSVPNFANNLMELPIAEIWRAVALSAFLCADGHIFRSADIASALEQQIPLAGIRGVPVVSAPQFRTGHGLCVFRDGNGLPTGVVWD